MMTKDNAYQAKHKLNLIKDHLYLLHNGIVQSTDSFMESLMIHHPIPRIPVIIRMPDYSQLKETGKTWVSFSFTVNLKTFIDYTDQEQYVHIATLAEVLYFPHWDYHIQDQIMACMLWWDGRIHQS